VTLLEPNSSNMASLDFVFFPHNVNNFNPPPPPQPPPEVPFARFLISSASLRKIQPKNKTTKLALLISNKCLFGKKIHFSHIKIGKLKNLSVNFTKLVNFFQKNHKLFNKKI
jgi:hypothetical protein